MKTIKNTKQFRKDFKKGIKQNRSKEKVRNVLDSLVQDLPLEASLRDHALQGAFANCRECHIEPDWLLIYEHLDSDTILLHRLGAHSELFK